MRTNVHLGEYGTGRVIGRRRPGSDELVWLLGLDGGRAHDPADLRVVLEAALGDLRAQLGG